MPNYRTLERALYHAIYSRTPQSKYSKTKYFCKRRNIQFLLTLEDFKNFIGKPCYYCNQFLEAGGSSLDRVDNTIGYVITNVVPCCQHCNSMKHTLPLDFFVKKIETVYKNLLAKGFYHQQD